jgi:seryl-tRNA synthetase
MKHILHYLLESRRLEVRCGLKTKEQTRKVYVHMLNGTLCATERTLCCLVENYQTAEVKIPEFSYPYNTELSAGCCNT